MLADTVCFINGTQLRWRQIRRLWLWNAMPERYWLHRCENMRHKIQPSAHHWHGGARFETRTELSCSTIPQMESGMGSVWFLPMKHEIGCGSRADVDDSNTQFVKYGWQNR
jgi:hypothetical protein